MLKRTYSSYEKHLDAIDMQQETQKRKIGISGTRTKNLSATTQWDDLIFVELLRIVTLYKPDDVIFISDGADSGANKIIEAVCKLLGYECEQSDKMIATVNELYCLWDEKSDGTKHTIEHLQGLIAKGSTIQLHIISFREMEHRVIYKIEINPAWLMPPRPLFEVYVVQVHYHRDHPFRIQKDGPNYYMLEIKQDLRSFFNEILQIKYNGN